MHLGKLEGCDAEGPDVNLEVLGQLPDNLRCHPEKSAHESIPLDLCVYELPCHPGVLSASGRLALTAAHWWL